MLNWRKLGLIFSPNGQYAWMQSHATLTTAWPLGGNRYRVYFSSRDARSRSHVSYVELDITAPENILYIPDYPVLAPGPLGYFDDHGVYAGSFVECDGQIRMYYAGWNPGLNPPMFYSSIGLAVSDDGGGTFRRAFKAPIIQRDEVDPWMVAAPFVRLESGIWRMWYISGLGWTEDGKGSFYHIKYTESSDGINWKRKGRVALELRPGETNIARLYVLPVGGGYQGWYSYEAGDGYRIGYAESGDGVVWTRRDELVRIEPSETGWDSEAQAYPCVFAHDGVLYMLYNGNRFGRDGFGLAVQDASNGI